MRSGSYVDAGGVRTYYEVSGEGPPLLFLHGGMCPLEDADAQLRGFATAHRVWAPERRGHGRTPDVPGPLTFELLAADTLAFMDAVGLDRAHLVGWSDGAAVALDIALQQPERVDRLVLIGHAIEPAGLRPEIAAALEAMTADEIPVRLRELQAAASPDGLEPFASVFDRLKQARRDRQVTLSDLARVEAPTLILIGQDDFVSIEHAAAAQRALPRGQLGVVPGAGHDLLRTRPEISNRLVLDFLAAAL